MELLEQVFSADLFSSMKCKLLFKAQKSDSEMELKLFQIFKCNLIWICAALREKRSWSVEVVYNLSLKFKKKNRKKNKQKPQRIGYFVICSCVPTNYNFIRHQWGAFLEISSIYQYKFSIQVDLSGYEKDFHFKFLT